MVNANGWAMPCSPKKILHLCADVGSDSAVYTDNGYEVILIGKEIGVENYTPPNDIYGIFANPVCTDFSMAKNPKKDGGKEGMFLVDHCLRIIRSCNPAFWVLENPATGSLKRYIGKPRFEYEPWWYGSPWTKRTALWGKFNIPPPIYHSWDDVPKNDKLYIRPKRGKPSLAFMHKSALKDIAEFHRFADKVKTDMCFRSLCSQNFAQSFYEVNK